MYIKNLLSICPPTMWIAPNTLHTLGCAKALYAACPSPWWPLQLPPSHDVQVQVVDALAAVASVIHDHPEPVLQALCIPGMRILLLCSCILRALADDKPYNMH